MAVRRRTDRNHGRGTPESVRVSRCHFYPSEHFRLIAEVCHFAEANGAELINLTLILVGSKWEHHALSASSVLHSRDLDFRLMGK
ncbi:hypothetical protein NDU88_001497 [Pleurodeles waltl]|uniref:Uncharacterized protein n=1 Tax=Pleurodeles waltl TaxID=8319 RepID=A0AAV7RBS9_PLEWA|nr:hypothetical protein NDU88_001497 [Pleurodeles waltl]